MNTEILLQRFVSSITLLVVTAAVSAQMTPATLGDMEEKKHFGRLIVFPETHGDANVIIHCFATVKSSGRIDKQAGCYLNNNWEPIFIEAVQKASKKAVFVPARDGKKTRKIGLLFQVEFIKTEAEQAINIYLNSGIQENVDEYGPNHIGAQRVLGSESWEKACPKHAGWVVIARSHVNEEGVASSVSLGHGGGIVPTGPCQQAIVDTIESSRFSPTYIDGVAVPSSYAEPFGN